MDLFTRPLEVLIKEFMKMPSVGPKSAQRMAFHFLNRPFSEIEKLCTALKDLVKIKPCKICFNYTEEELCPVCSDKSRNSSIVCVVSDFRDLAAIEKSGNYNGVYHVLGGLISPMDGIGPEDLNIISLLEKIGAAEEIILAVNPTVNGETTSLYILRKIREISDIKVSRIAYGVPVGSNLEYTDGITISRAIEGRRFI